MTTPNAKPRAGEQRSSERALEELAVIETCDRALLIHGLPAYSALAAQNRELVEALASLLDRVDRNGGLGEYKGGMPFVTQTARELLAKHGR